MDLLCSRADFFYFSSCIRNFRGKSRSRSQSLSYYNQFTSDSSVRYAPDDFPRNFKVKFLSAERNPRSHRLDYISHFVTLIGLHCLYSVRSFACKSMARRDDFASKGISLS